MRITVAVHGRFHSFDLAAALLRQGVDVHLLTNYPKQASSKWFPRDRTHSFVTHGVLARVAHRLFGGDPPRLVEAGVKQMFGRWAAAQNERLQPDVAYSWSGIAEETLRRCHASTCAVARGSSHIVVQSALLRAEELRTGQQLERPSDWIINREQTEYELADRIIVPSSFARNTFIEQGVDAQKVRAVNLSLRAPGFRAEEDAIAARLQRVRSGQPLRVLYTGMLSYRKGMHDMRPVLGKLGARMDFRFVGPLLPECREFAREAARIARVEPAVPQNSLGRVYEWGDIFILPTIEDGFAVVLAQAQSAGLPILTTTNCGGPDIIAQGGQGWIVPIRNPDSLIEQLRWCDDNREAVAEMVEKLHVQPPQRDWADVAADFMRAVA